MTPAARILIVDDEATQLAMLGLALGDEGYDITACATASAALEALKGERFDLLVTDLTMPGTDGITLLRSAIAADPLMVGIVVSGTGSIITAVEAMKAGALDYILKPFRVAEIVPVLERALTVRRLRVENAGLLQRVGERTAEVEQANRDLLSANRQLITANQDLEAFGYSVSHDLSAPVRMIAGFAKELTRHHVFMPSASRELLDSISGNAELMTQLIDGLLRLSGLSRQALTWQPIDLDQLVRAVAAEQQRACPGRDIAIHVGNLGGCSGDTALLRQVFANLLSNACKYTRCTDHAVIRVEVRHVDDQPVYAVSDNGMGFDMKHADGLFGVFKRLHNDARIEGIGIGLSLVQRIIHRHGGRIWAEASVGEGACFRFTLGRSPA